MPDKTTLGTRMKENYENRSKQFLTRRTPTIIRLDGKSFHTYCKGMDKPFDEGFREDMQLTTAYLLANIQGAKCGYTQSDEITLLLTDYDNLQTDAWFDYNVQKMVSVSASMASAKFNDLRLRRKIYSSFESSEFDLVKIEWNKQPLAVFDARVFQIADKEEVVNCFLWRQQDCEKNSISMLAQSLYSTSELHKKHAGDMQEMSFAKGHNWNDLSPQNKRGSFIVKQTYVNGEVFPQKDNSIIIQDGKYFKIPPIVRGKIRISSELENPTIRTKWEVVADTPFFGRERETILKFL